MAQSEFPLPDVGEGLTEAEIVSWKVKPGDPVTVNQVLVEIEHGLATLANRPVALVWGMRDWCFTPWFLERFIEFFPRAEIHRLADVGHYVMEEAPERVVEIVQAFLARHPVGASPAVEGCSSQVLRRG